MNSWSIVGNNVWLLPLNNLFPVRLLLSVKAQIIRNELNKYSEASLETAKNQIILQ